MILKMRKLKNVWEKRYLVNLPSFTGKGNNGIVSVTNRQETV
jgi:hypothetical protein